MTANKKHKKPDILSVKLPDGFKALLTSRAESEYTSVSQVVIQAIRKFLDIPAKM